jgi:hypothetical protein
MDDAVRCERQAMTLTQAGCARLWQSAQDRKPAPWEGRAKCLTCPIGARHAGKAVAPTAEAVRQIENICPRCDKPADRMIRGQYCVCCYNRHLEVKRGYNAKGVRPALADQLHPGVVSVTEGTRSWLASFDLLKSQGEAIVLLSKRAGQPMMFGAPPAIIPGYGQTELAL